MHHTGKKESKKEILKKDKKNNVTKNLKLFGNSNPDPPNQLELKDNASTLQGGKTFCASFCASFIAGSRRAFLCVDCVEHVREF